MPTRVRFGRGVVGELRSYVNELGAKRILLVTGSKSMKKAGFLGRVAGLLDGLDVTVFDEVESDPSVETVGKAVEAAGEVDAIVSLGGGSVIDAAKAVSVVLGNGGDISAYLMGRKVEEPGPPVIAIPTTAGTGSEVTEVSVLTDKKRMIKKSFRSVYMYPAVALDDLELTKTMPKDVTASSGLDALTHAVEALTSKKSQPIPDQLCLEAARIIAGNILKAYENGDDLKAREAMMLGSLMAGFGITHAGAGLAHGLAYSLWKVAGTTHGLACGILLPHVMKYNLGYEEGKYEQLARHCGFKKPGDLISKIVELNSAMGIPKRLAEIGVREDDVESMIELGMSGSTKVNPRPVDETAIRNFLLEII